MSDLDSVAKHVQSFYRLTGTVSADGELVERGEAVDDVAYICLTDGCRAAQRWMIDQGYGGWRQNSAALSFSTDAAGFKSASLPADFLRAYGNMVPGRGALVKDNGDRWADEILPTDDHLKGDFYFIRGEELWLARTATAPTPLYLDYYYRHPVWNAGTTIDFPLEARRLIVAEAASVGMEENWLPGGQDMELKIMRALAKAQNRARHIARPTKEPRRFRKPLRFGNRW